MNNSVKNWREIKRLQTDLGKTGKLLLWTKIHVAPSEFEHQTPYFSGIIQLEDSSRMSIQLVDVNEEDLKVGLKVKLTIRRYSKVEPTGLINYCFKAVPI